MSKHKHERKHEHKHEHRHKKSDYQPQSSENNQFEITSPNLSENIPNSSVTPSNELNSSETNINESPKNELNSANNSSTKEINSDKKPKISSMTPKDEASVYKIPVILSERKLELFLESLIDFDDLVVNINNVKRIVYLTEYTIIPIDNKVTSSKIFLKGFLRNIIEYGAFSCINSNNIKTDIKQIFVDTPFDCTTKIDFLTPPIYNTLDDYTSINSEPIDCELKNSEVFSVNIICDKNLVDENFPYIYTFKTLKEKIILTLTINLIQKQYVNIKNNHENK